MSEFKVIRMMLGKRIPIITLKKQTLEEWEPE